MRRSARLALIALAVGGLVGARWWQDGRRRTAEDRQAVFADGNAAMKALNAADATFPDAVRAQLATLAVEAAVEPARAGATLEARVLPMFDDYLATIDRAIAAATRVLALEPDPAVARSVDAIRARAATTRTMRAGLAALRAQIAAGATSEAIARELQAIGLTALRASLPTP